MPRLLRPHIPLAVRVEVAERQVVEQTGRAPLEVDESDSKWLARLLGFLFDGQRAHLDHDPPLGARRKVFIDDKHVGYDPPANDPKHLVYREAVAHRVKTNVRGEHGQHPDRVLIVKNRRLEEREAGGARGQPSKTVKSRRPTVKIRGRSFQQQRCCIGARCFCDARRRKRCGNYRQPVKEGIKW